MKAFCISHVKDVDGIGAASLVVAATGAEFRLADYADLMDELDHVPKGIDRFVLCDLGSDNSKADAFVAKLGAIASKSNVTYIDHHFMPVSTMRKLRKAGVTLVHDDTECASMLAYKTFKDELPERARMTALMGAVTDYMDDSPMASRLMEQADRQFVLLEATMLAYAIARKGDEEGFPDSIVRELSHMRHPHEIPGVPLYAVEQLSETVKLGEEVKREGVKLGRMAYMMTDQRSTGNVAKLLIGGFEVPVGVALKKAEKGWCEVSLRGTSESKIHLGRMISAIAADLGGSGGGHRKAAGCRIPCSTVDELLARLAAKV